MIFTDLHKILDDENRRLSLDELKQVIYELKQDCFKEQATLFDDYSNARCGERHYIHTNAYYMGEQKAFQIVLDLFEHLTSSNESDLEKRVKALEDYNEQQKEMKIEQLKAENEMLQAQLKSKSMPTLEEWIKEKYSK